MSEPTQTPKACDLLITGGTILDLDSPGGAMTDAGIAIVGNEIAAVGPAASMRTEWAPTRVIDATGQVVSPGFIDGHVHLAAFLGASGAYQPSTEPGLFSGASRTAEIVPMVAKMCAMEVPPDLVATVLRPLLAAMLRSGFTGVVDAGSAGHLGLVAAATDVGIRAAIGPSLADMWHDDGGELGVRADPDALLDKARELVTHIDGAADGRVRAVVSGVEPIACSDRLLAGLAEIAEECDLPTHVHTHVSDASVRDHDAAWGTLATRRLTDAGLLSPRCTLMHVGSITDADIDAYASSGVTANHNPLGNAMLGFGVASGRSAPRLLDACVPVVLGSDYGPSMIATPFDLIRAALMVNREIAGADDALTLEQALTMATNSGVALGRPGRLGRIAPGQLADIVLLDTNGSHHLGAEHPVPALALRARASDVTTVIVNGEVVVDDRSLVGASEQSMLDEARACLAHLGAH